MALIAPRRAPGRGPGKSKDPTATKKKFRFLPFSQRIARLKVDPVHTIQRSPIADSKNDLSQSHFRSALDEWAELNLSQTFTTFYQKVSPLSESLPQLIHHADAIFEALIEHIEKNDPLALEPLLKLVSQLAHDLGRTFEKYFERTVRAVASASTTHDDAGVVEWCFTCLAWTFKYLSRLLVNDLRPLLDIMIPYMSSKKEHIRRFTAESLAFLIRKAVALYDKNSKPLRSALESLFQKLENGPTNQAFESALVTLLAESIIGTDGNVHSTAAQLVYTILDVVLSQETLGESGTRVLEGTIICTIHQTNASGFQPLLEAIRKHAETSRPNSSTYSWNAITRFLRVCAGTRKGSRIGNWKPVVEVVIHLTKQSFSSEPLESKPSAENVLAICALAVAYAPMDQLLPFMKDLGRILDSDLDSKSFFIFTETVATLNHQRFQDLVFPHLQQFVASKWKIDEPGLCWLLHNLHEGGVSVIPGKPGYVFTTEEWEDNITNKLLCVPDLAEDLAYSKLGKWIRFPQYESTRTHLRKALFVSLHKALDQPTEPMDVALRVSLGWNFQLLLTLWERNNKDEREHVHWRKIAQQDTSRFLLVPFVQALSEMATRFELHDSDLSSFDVTYSSIAAKLTNNMLSNSMELRKASLSLLIELSKRGMRPELLTALGILHEILTTPYTVANARQLAMLLRRLPQKQEEVAARSDIPKLIPFFCLGLLPAYHDSLRKDVCSVLGQMLSVSETENAVVDIITQWLQAPDMPERPSGTAENDTEYSRASAFTCTNVTFVDKLTQNATQNYSNPAELLKDLFETAHMLHAPQTPADSAFMAIQLLLEVPELAEKRSKAIIPIFLSIQHERLKHHVPSSGSSTSTYTLSPEIDKQGWSYPERRAFLQLMGKFLNPRVLYRSTDVHSCLLDYLTNGSPEIRKLALEALVKWKDPGLQQHYAQLLEIAEEKNTTMELAALLNAEEDSSLIRSNDRVTVLPLLLRLVFGQLINRVGTHGSQEAKRKSILRLLFRMQESEVATFLEIALGPLQTVLMVDSGIIQNSLLLQDVVNLDQQYGFLRMILSMLDILQTQFEPYGSKIVDAVLYCTTRAGHQLNGYEDGQAAPALIRNIRRTGLQCLIRLFQVCPRMDWKPYLPLIFAELITPRLPNFHIETARDVTTVLRLLSTWAESEVFFPLLRDYNEKVMTSVWRTLESPTTRDDVSLFVVDHVVAPLGAWAKADDTNYARTMLEAEAEPMFQALLMLLQRSHSKNMLLTVTSILPSLTACTQYSGAAGKILDLLITILSEPNQRVPPHIKGQTLQAAEGILALSTSSAWSASHTKLFEIVSASFNYFKDDRNRLRCAALLRRLSVIDVSLEESALICEQLHAVSEQQLDSIDFDKRLSAFASINDMSTNNTTHRQWLPILHNLIYFARTDVDFSIRSQAVNALKRFVLEACQNGGVEMESLIRNVQLPACKKAVAEASEIVRQDFVILLGLIVKHLKAATDLQDMVVLLVGGDEEASFFSNILHIQQHRRFRAIRRLTTEVERGAISAANVSEVFLPLIEKFVQEDSEDSDQGVKGQSIAALPVLFQWMNWKAFRTTFRQYKRDLESESRSEKDAIRLLGHATDSLTKVINEKDADRDDGQPRSHLASTLPDRTTILNELRNHFLPSLTGFSHYKDEAQLSLRLPAATVAIKLIKLFPQEERSVLIAPILLDISQVLRSRAQDSRNIARNTLSEAVVLLGPSSMDFVVKELRTALTRGYQLHVLSYTLHTILLNVLPDFQVGDLDYCLPELVKVVIDDIFGAVGQEKENQDYISTMKEVKNSKSPDSMELLAQSTGVRSLSKLVTPIEELLEGTLNIKQQRHVDELLRRVGVGISHNPSASTRDLLVFAYEMIQAFHVRKGKEVNQTKSSQRNGDNRFIVQMDTANKSTAGKSSLLLYKLAKFAIDLVRSAVSRHSELLTVENVHGFLPVLGDALVEGQEDVKVSAMRLLSTIIKLPIPELDQNALIYVMEAVKVVKGSVNIDAESAQAALKLVAAVIRDRRDTNVRDSDIAYLLQRTTPDLEEPDRQGVTFNFVKAVMARRLELPEIYTLADQVATMMVTSQVRSSRDAARTVYIQFVLDYPQSKARWVKQVKFLMKNLEYQHPEGRQSVMSAIHGFLSKLNKESKSDFISNFFVPVVLRISNDEDARCREMAELLLSQMFQQAEQTQINTLLDPLRHWVEQDENEALLKLGMQAWVVFFGSEGIEGEGEAEVPHVRSAITKALQNTRTRQEDLEIRRLALELLSKLITAHPSSVTTMKQLAMWKHVFALLSIVDFQTQNLVAELVALMFREFVLAKSDKAPLSTRYGLQLDKETTVSLLRTLTKTMKHNQEHEELKSSILPSLLFVGRVAELSELQMQIRAKREDAIEETDGPEGDPEEKTEDTKMDSDISEDESEEVIEIRTIPAIQYLLDQCAAILRLEPSRHTTARFRPKTAALELLTSLIPQLSTVSLPSRTVQSLLIPLQHITNPNVQPPRSTDSSFPLTYQEFTTAAQTVMDVLRARIGDAEYLQAMTAANRTVRDRREGRRRKRRIERVAEPERAAREKRRKNDRKKERKKEIHGIHRGKRRGELGF